MKTIVVSTFENGLQKAVELASKIIQPNYVFSRTYGVNIIKIYRNDNNFSAIEMVIEENCLKIIFHDKGEKIWGMSVINTQIMLMLSELPGWKSNSVSFS